MLTAWQYKSSKFSRPYGATRLAELVDVRKQKCFSFSCQSMMHAAHQSQHSPLLFCTVATPMTSDFKVNGHWLIRDRCVWSYFSLFVMLVTADTSQTPEQRLADLQVEAVRCYRDLYLCYQDSQTGTFHISERWNVNQPVLFWNWGRACSFFLCLEHCVTVEFLLEYHKPFEVCEKVKHLWSAVVLTRWCLALVKAARTRKVSAVVSSKGAKRGTIHGHTYECVCVCLFVCRKYLEGQRRIQTWLKGTSTELSVPSVCSYPVRWFEAFNHKSLPSSNTAPPRAICKARDTARDSHGQVQGWVMCVR